MPLTIHADAPPLRVDDTGTVRVGQTRVILEVVVHAFCRACVRTVSIVSMIEMVSSSGINELSTSPACSRRATSSA